MQRADVCTRLSLGELVYTIRLQQPRPGTYLSDCIHSHRKRKATRSKAAVIRFDGKKVAFSGGLCLFCIRETAAVPVFFISKKNKTDGFPWFISQCLHCSQYFDRLYYPGSAVMR